MLMPMPKRWRYESYHHRRLGYLVPDSRNRYCAPRNSRMADLAHHTAVGVSYLHFIAICVDYR